MTFDNRFIDYKKALKIIKKGVAQGDSQSTSLLGYYYYKGLEVEQDFKLAMLCFKVAADKGDANGAFFYGTLLIQGSAEVQQNHKKGKEYILQAVKSNHSYATLAYGSGINYFSCTNSLSFLIKITDNTISNYLKNLVQISMDEKKYKRAGIYLLLISLLANRLGYSNFYMIYQRYLKSYTNQDFLNEINEAFEYDYFLQQLEEKQNLRIRSWEELMHIDNPQYTQARKLDNRVFDLKYFKKDKPFFQRQVQLIEIHNDSNQTQRLGNISLQQLQNVYDKDIKNNKQLDAITQVYNRTIIYLKENGNNLFIPERAELYKAEAHFIMAKIYLFKAYKFKEDYILLSKQYLEKAMSISTPRSFIYRLLYIYLKLLLLQDISIEPKIVTALWLILLLVVYNSFRLLIKRSQKFNQLNQQKIIFGSNGFKI